jgi:hypothetical protein
MSGTDFGARGETEVDIARAFHRHPEEAAKRPSKDDRPPISHICEIGSNTCRRKSAIADLRWLASLAPQGDGTKLAGCGDLKDANGRDKPGHDEFI